MYFNEGFITPFFFTDDPPAAPAPTARLVWPAMSERPLCQYPARREAAKLARDNSQLTAQQKAAVFVTHVVMHEIGHTLGLKHNFKGSLVPPSSSVMDYLDTPEALQREQAGSYDIDAIKLLYGLSTKVPSDPYCDDNDALHDPDCARFDWGANPLDEAWGPYYLYSGLHPYFRDKLLTYVCAGASAEVRGRAWELPVQQPDRCEHPRHHQCVVHRTGG